MKLKGPALLLLISFAAILIHGYHPYAEDAEIYVPGIVKILHPSYYPFGQEFFGTHAHLTLFPNLIAATARITHIPLDWTLFIWHFASIFLVLLACWRIAAKCFSTEGGRWAAVVTVACLLTLPVAGTALYIIDQYLNPRSLATFAFLFAIDAMLNKKSLKAALWVLFAAVVHPFTAVFALAFVIILATFRTVRSIETSPSLAAISILLLFHSPSAIYWRCMNEHSYCFLLRWHWYEWLGIVAPLAILWWFGAIGRQRNQPALELLSHATAAFGFIFFIAALFVSILPQLAILAVYQPMRSLQIVYVFFFLLAGGLLGEHVLKTKLLRWLLLFVPIAAAMLFVQLQLFPGDRHVEWPGASPENPWIQAFAWIRQNTPADAIFALDPQFMELPGENHQGFRAAAERSRLADTYKDWSAALLYPWLPLADHVFDQTQATREWRSFQAGDFARLKRVYGVTWVIIQQTARTDLSCPYQNSAVRVCRLESARN